LAQVQAQLAANISAWDGPSDALPAAITACTRCPLHCNATQAVLGQGPLDAALMIVGEQPGDQEDLSGKPFVGPAGQLFDQIAAKAGLNRQQAYVTNAVKHFKFTPRGKRRIHQTATSDEIEQCRWWLDAERARIRPKLTLAMGAVAAEAVTGNTAPILARRGKIEKARDGGQVLITLHPAYLLRLPAGEAQQRAVAAFAADLRQAVNVCADVVQRGSG
jgi:DNA polymerase